MAAHAHAPDQVQDQVVVVYPSGPTVPANVLRLTVRFARPARGPGRPDLALAGVAQPFIDQDLWSDDGRLLTLLFDPSRLKQGVGANLSLGRVLHPGQRIVLTAGGHSVKAWTVTEAQAQAPDPHLWTLVPPHLPGGHASVIIRFDHPIDALSRDLIAVVSSAGEAVAGEAALLDGEQVWQFRPTDPWRPGAYRIAVSPKLEDASGNSVAEPFEVRTGAGPQPAAASGLPDFIIRQ